MRNRYLSELDEAMAIQDDGRRFSYLLAIERSLLQYTAISTFEYVDFSKTEESAFDRNSLLQALHSLNDSSPLEVLDRLIPVIRGDGWAEFCFGWFESNENAQPASVTVPLVTQLQEWVAFRNDRPAHGVLDKRTIDTWTPKLFHIVRATVGALATALPKLKTDELGGHLELDTPSGVVDIRSIRVIQGRPLVLRKLRTKSGIWRVIYQTLDSEKSEDGYYELEENSSLLSFERTSSDFVQRSVPVADRSWQPLVKLPARQTSTFEGRTPELEELLDWYKDFDSRMCLVYGDGGIGKTTLVLEFLHDILEGGAADAEFLPQIICFYSAKLTKWTPDGLVHFRAVSPVLADAVRDVVSAIAETRTREWFAAKERAIVDKAATVWAELGIKRADVLLVVDNVETLARKPQDELALARLLRQISQKLARVLVTSRRREKIEARPIEVLPMDDTSGAQLLRSLAIEYQAEPLQQAGDARLRKIVRDVRGKPLLLDVLARYISGGNVSIDDALTKVRQGARGELGEFLYEDAWSRMTQEQRAVFLALNKTEVPITNDIVGWVCAEMEIPHSVWLDAFLETHFGDQIEYGTDYDIAFTAIASNFFHSKLDGYDSKVKKQVESCARGAQSRYESIQEAEQRYRTDRVAEAFRTGAARAAKLAAQKGEFDEAKEWYKEALRLDANNSALFDRFAWFLMHYTREYKEASSYSERAITLSPESDEPYFTAGMVAYRMRQRSNGDELMQQAEAKGKPRHLCQIQMAQARIEDAKSEQDVRRISRLLTEAARYADMAEKDIAYGAPFSDRNLWTCEQIRRRIAALRKKYGDFHGDVFTSSGE